MYTLRLTDFGDSMGVVLPKELLEKLDLKAGDEIYLTDSPYGLCIASRNPELEAQKLAARAVTAKRRAVLKELAK